MVAPLYVSGLLLRVIWIGVKACIDATLYVELFITSITEKHILIPLRIGLSPLLHRSCKPAIQIKYHNGYMWDIMIRPMVNH